MKFEYVRPTLIALAAVAAATIAACGGGGADTGGPGPAPTQSGTLGVSLTDAPACGFDAVNVTVSKVRVHQNGAAGDSDSGWSDITLSPARKINLLNLTNGVLETLGATSLPPGKYNQLRLVLDANGGAGTANTVVATGTTVEKTLDTPSAVQSGIKIAGTFDVVSGQRTDLVLDFDACKSVLTKGNGKFALKPVIKLVPTVSNGIKGFISPALLSSGVSVSAQQNGAIVGSTAPNPASGEFILSRLVPGNYDVVITADGHAAAVVSAVPVATVSSITALSTAAAPLVLATSPAGSIAGTVSMTPASASGEAAYVAARQTFAGGPTVVIKYAGADLATGAYTLNNLPVAAPQYATYSATLPLTFSAATTSTPGAGQYSVSASATGYATQTRASAVDIVTQNASNINFALVP